MMNCNTGSNTHNNNNKIHFDSLLVFFSSPVYFFDRIFHFFFLTFTAIVWFETAPASQLFAFCVFGWVLFAFCQWAHEKKMCNFCSTRRKRWYFTVFLLCTLVNHKRIVSVSSYLLSFTGFYTSMAFFFEFTVDSQFFLNIRFIWCSYIYFYNVIPLCFSLILQLE